MAVFSPSSSVFVVFLHHNFESGFMLLSNEQSEKQLIAFFLFFWLLGSVQTAYEFELTDIPACVRGKETKRECESQSGEIEMCWKFDTYTILLFTLFCVIFRYDFTLDGNRKKISTIQHTHTHISQSIINFIGYVLSCTQCTVYSVLAKLLATHCYSLLVAQLIFCFYLRKKQFYFQSAVRKRIED